MDTHLAKGPTQPLGSGDFSHYHIRAGWASWRPMLSINTQLSSESSSTGQGGGEGCVVALRYTPPPTSPHTGSSVCGKPSDMGGGQQEEEDPVWSDCQVPSLYKTGCGGSLGSSLNMTSWAVLLIASVLLVAPGEDVPLKVDPDSCFSSQLCFLRLCGPKHELQGHLRPHSLLTITTEAGPYPQSQVQLSLAVTWAMGRESQWEGREPQPGV